MASHRWAGTFTTLSTPLSPWRPPGFLAYFNPIRRIGSGASVFRLTIAEAEIQKRILARSAARAAKNFADSDRIRNELVAMGVKLKDNKDGTTTWEVAR